jgi:hypothetical protein
LNDAAGTLEAEAGGDITLTLEAAMTETGGGEVAVPDVTGQGQPAGDFASDQSCGQPAYQNFAGCSNGLPVFSDFSVEEVTKVTQMNIGDTVLDGESDIFNAHNWLFNGNAGQVVTITVQGVGGADPQILVFGPTGTILVTDLNNTGGDGAETAVVSLTDAGLYTVRVEFWTGGSYSLSVVEGGDPNAAAGNADTSACSQPGMINLIRCEGDLPVFDDGSVEDIVQITTMNIGDTVTGTVSSIFDAHNWLFRGTAGQTVAVSVTGGSGADPVIIVFDAAGNIVQSDLDASGADGTETALVILNSEGWYTVRVEFWSAGTYTLSVQAQ